MVIGNSEAWGGELVVGHSVMQDAIDRDAVREAIVNAGISFDWALSPEERGRIVNVFAKCEASPDGLVRGRRHTMLDDSDINNTRHARSVVNAVVSSVVGDPMMFVSGGAEHQGPPGGGTRRGRRSGRVAHLHHCARSRRPPSCSAMRAPASIRSNTIDE